MEGVTLLMKYKGIDNQHHELIRRKAEPQMSESLKEFVMMRKPQPKKDYEQRDYKIKGSRLRYSRSRSAYVENREQEVKTKKILWELLFEPEKDLKLLRVPAKKLQWKNEDGSPVYSEITYYFAYRFNTIYFATDSNDVKQSKFDNMGIDPKPFVLPDNALIDNSLKFRKERDH